MSTAANTITSREIAEDLGTKHRHVIILIEAHLDILSELGECCKRETPRDTKGGRPGPIYDLNVAHYRALIALMKSCRWKRRLKVQTALAPRAALHLRALRKLVTECRDNGR